MEVMETVRGKGWRSGAAERKGIRRWVGGEKCSEEGGAGFRRKDMLLLLVA